MFANFSSPVPNRDSFLSLVRDSQGIQLQAQGLLINRFQKSRSENLVHSQGGADDPAGQFCG